MLIMQHTFTYTSNFFYLHFKKEKPSEKNGTLQRKYFPFGTISINLLYLHLKGIHDYWGMNFYYAIPYIIFYFFRWKNFYYTLHQPLIFFLFSALHLRYQKYYYIIFLFRLKCYGWKIFHIFPVE